MARSLRLAMSAAAVVVLAACNNTPPLPQPSVSSRPPASPSPPAPSPTQPSPSPSEPTSGPPPEPAKITTVQVIGNRLVDQDDQPIRLTGFDHSGAEYSCIEGDGFFDTPDGTVPDAADMDAMQSWKGANFVRVPLNEQCWLGLAAAPAQYSGAAYRAAVHTFVEGMEKRGFAVLLDLHRSAPADGVSKDQEQAPDQDHSIDFWKSVASGFGQDKAVMFDLFNEPFPYAETNSTRAWQCWRDGGCQLTSTNTGKQYTAAGMNELIAAVRGAGAKNVVLAGGIYWAESMTQWLQYEPSDPLHQLAASFHAYSFNTYCSSVTCYDRELVPIMDKVPVVVGEIGPSLSIDPTQDPDENCPSSAVLPGGWVDETMNWLDAHDVSYAGWSWNPWGDCWSLVTGWGGEPTPLWGMELRRRLAAASAGG